jgi:hypothetical protein
MREDTGRYRERMKLRSTQRRAKKTEWVKKFGGACADCKQSYPDCVFDFHHVDPETKDKEFEAPAKLFMLSNARIGAELAKCVMLCANCHRQRHAHQEAA